MHFIYFNTFFTPVPLCLSVKFAELETILGDLERARAIFELAINQPKLEMPEVLWKAYIDFELEQEEFERTRALYRRLLQRTKHVKVSIRESKQTSFRRVRGCRGVGEEWRHSEMLANKL